MSRQFGEEDGLCLHSLVAQQAVFWLRAPDDGFIAPGLRTPHSRRPDGLMTATQWHQTERFHQNTKTISISTFNGEIEIDLYICISLSRQKWTNQLIAGELSVFDSFANQLPRIFVKY